MFEKEYRPRKPVVSTLTSANREFQRWLEQNAHKDYTDAIGLVWIVELQHQVFPDPVNRHSSLHRLSFQIQSEIDKKRLLEHGVLDPSKDQRLLELMDDSTITFVYQRPVFETDTLDKVRTQVLDDLVKIRHGLAAVNLSETYRKVIGRYVNSRFAMTYPRAAVPQIKIDLEV